MTQGEVTFTREGRTFTGHFETVGHDDVRAVSLRFGSRSISAALGHDDPERVAKTLLGEVTSRCHDTIVTQGRSTH